MRKRGVLAAMLTGVMLVLCGCGGMTTDEAKDYVKEPVLYYIRKYLNDIQLFSL